MQWTDTVFGKLNYFNGVPSSLSRYSNAMHTGTLTADLRVSYGTVFIKYEPRTFLNLIYLGISTCNVLDNLTEWKWLVHTLHTYTQVQPFLHFPHIVKARNYKEWRSHHMGIISIGLKLFEEMFVQVNLFQSSSFFHLYFPMIHRNLLKSRWKNETVW